MVEALTPAWRHGAVSSGGACVQVAVVPGSKEDSDYVIVMGDAEDPEGPVLIFFDGERGSRGTHMPRAYARR